MVLFYSMFDYQNKNVDDAKKLLINGIDRISFRANVKRFTRKTKKKDNFMSIIRQCKNNIMLFFSV